MPPPDTLEEEITKLKKSLGDIREQQRIKRLNLSLELVKFIGGTLLIGGATLFLNHQIKAREQEFKETASNRDYVKEFVQQALDKDIDSRIRFAQYFSVELGGKWTEYYNVLIKERDANKGEQKPVQEALATEHAKIVQLEKNPADESELDKARQRASELEEQLELLKRPLEALRPPDDIATGWLYIGWFDDTHKKWNGSKLKIGDELPQIGIDYDLASSVPLRREVGPKTALIGYIPGGVSLKVRDLRHRTNAEVWIETELPRSVLKQ